MRWKEAGLVLALSCGGSVPAFADVLYDIRTPFGGGAVYEYSFVEPSILKSTASVAGTALTIITAAPCGISSASIFNPSSNSPEFAETFASGCQFTSSTTFGFNTPWTAPGYYSNGGVPVSSVTITTLASTTPEPSGLMLLLTGILGAGGVLRKHPR